MKDAIKGYLALATGLAEVPRQKAVAAAKALVAQGEATAGQVSSLTEDLLTQSRSNREAVTALVRYEVDRGLGRVGLASNDEVSELTARVRALEDALRALQQAQAAPSTAAPDKAAPSQGLSAKAAPRRAAPTKAAPAAPAAPVAPAGSSTVQQPGSPAPAAGGGTSS